MMNHVPPVLSRRRILGTAVAGAAGSLLGACAPDSSAGVTGATITAPRTVYDLRLDFGAVGDGIVDDYEPLAAAAAVLSGSVDVTLYIPEGTYYLGREDSSGAQRGDIAWVNIQGLHIAGIGRALFILDGAYTRASGADATPIPFDMVQCRSFVIRGIELDGGVRNTQSPAGLTEGTSYGIRTNRCEDYLIEQVEVHHFATDGLMLGTGGPHEVLPDGTRMFFADRNAILRNVDSYSHGRSCLTISQVVDLVAVACHFTDARRDIGSYPGHGPGAGVNAEPGRAGTVEYGGVVQAVDADTTNITLSGCEVTGSVGAQVSLGGSDYVGIVLLDGCIARRSEDSSAWTIVATASHVTIRGCEIDGSVYGALAAVQAGTLSIDACTIVTSGRGVAVSALPGSPALRFRMTDTSVRVKSAIQAPLIQLRADDHGVVIGCEFAYAAAAYTRTDGRWQIPFVLSGVNVLAGNMWTSEVNSSTGVLSLGAEYLPEAAWLGERLVAFIPRADVPNPSGDMIWSVCALSGT